MLTTQELRAALDEATRGGVRALALVTQETGCNPHIWLQPEARPGMTRVMFYATDETGHVRYFDSVLTPSDPLRDTQVLFFERMKEVRKQTAQIQAGFARFDAGLEPDYEEPDRSRN